MYGSLTKGVKTFSSYQQGVKDKMKKTERKQRPIGTGLLDRVGDGWVDCPAALSSEVSEHSAKTTGTTGPFFTFKSYFQVDVKG